jgi:hypothetical protein
VSPVSSPLGDLRLTIRSMIAPAALRLYYFGIELSSPDPTLHGVLASVCAQIETSYAIISTTIPCLRPFMSSLNTHYGAPAKPNQLETLTKGGRSIGTKREARGNRWEPGNFTNITRGDKNSIDSHDSKRMIITKNTDWVVEFDEQSGRQTPQAMDVSVASARD